MTADSQSDTHLTNQDLVDQLRQLGHRCAELEQQHADLQHQYASLQAQRDVWHTERAAQEQQIRALRDAVVQEQHRRIVITDRFITLVNTMRDMMLAYRMIQDMIPSLFWWRRSQFTERLRTLPDRDALDAVLAPYDELSL